jgi:acetylglutamate kinase
MLSALDDHAATVSVTSPLTLLRELFTVRGAGTLVKSGSVIERSSDYRGIRLERLRALLESSFERPLRAGFFERPPSSVYLETEYRGVAILEPSEVAPYLSKLAVEPLARGEGMGQDLWQALTRDHSALVWRSRPNNPIAHWYAGACDGLVRLPRWHVFWRGVSVDRVPRAVDEALARPNDFV